MPSVPRVRHFAIVSSLFAFALLFLAISLVLADVTFHYYSDGRLKAVCNPVGQGVTYTYDPDGNIIMISHNTCPTPTATATP
jgi:YD repeat-containing protein